MGRQLQSNLPRREDRDSLAAKRRAAEGVLSREVLPPRLYREPIAAQRSDTSWSLIVVVAVVAAVISQLLGAL